MKKILIIDDNPDAADTLASILELSGHQAEAVYGPVHGLNAVKSYQPDIVFLDIGMPVINGYQVAILIREDDSLKQPYLIAFTAWDDKASIARSQQAGFDRHLTKTSEYDVLLANIDEAIRSAN